MDEKLLKELLECSVCLEQLDATSKVLPCQHTFCRRCLRDIVDAKKELRCPECRVLVQVKVEDLPGNILLIRLLEGMKTKSHLNSIKVDADAINDSNSSVTQPISLQDQDARQTPPGAELNKGVIKQVSRCYPWARAYSSYEAKEPGELSFKEGDTIFLQRKINQNWYYGELNGKYGFVPSVHVRVILLRTHVPQCKALYDFKMSGKDEKDCLTFKKGEVITVIRRIDDNWAEGKMFDKIGIFPISFVEMNAAAHCLLKLSMNTQPGPSRVAPPTPVSNGADSIMPKNFTSARHSEITNSVVGLSSGAPVNKAADSLPNSPLHQSMPVAQTIERTMHALMRSASQRNSNEREKRHSLSSLSMSLLQKAPQVSSAHEHSTEILSTAGGDILAAPHRGLPVPSPHFTLDSSKDIAPSKSTKTINKVTSNNTESTGNEGREHCATAMSKTPTKSNRSATGEAAIGSKSSTSFGATTASVTLAQPIICMALFNCKPEKEDELLLKRGEYYTVTEKYQDGWFKGTSLRTGRSGVFPGNYVRISKLSGRQNQLLQDPNSFKAQQQVSNKKSAVPVVIAPPRLKSLPSSTAALGNTSIAGGSEVPGPSPLQSSSKTTSTKGSRTFAPELLEWARSLSTASSTPSSQKTLGNHGNPFLPLQEQGAQNDSAAEKDLLPWMTKLQLNQASPCSNANTPSSCGSNAAFSSYCNQQPRPDSRINQSCESPSRTPIWKFGGDSHRDNALSPSAPSMSVMSPPNVSLRAPANFHSPHVKPEKVRKDKTRESLMKRITGKKKGRRLAANFCDNPSFVDHTASVVDSLQTRVMPGAMEAASTQFKNSACEEEAPEQQPVLSSHSKQSGSKERFRCVVPYPPNSEYELELKVGDIVYVHKKREDGWYKGTLARTGKTGLFPASFVDAF